MNMKENCNHPFCVNWRRLKEKQARRQEEKLKMRAESQRVARAFEQQKKDHTESPSVNHKLDSTTESDAGMKDNEDDRQRR